MCSVGITLSQMNAGHVQEGIVLRLLRHWFARNVRRGGQVMGIDLLFVDRQSTVAHASINVSYMASFQPLLREGAVYVLKNFDVDRGISRYRLSDFHLTLRLNDTTSMVEIADSVPDIPQQVFRFRTHAELESIAGSNTDLPDIVGQVSSAKAVHDSVTNDLKRMLLSLTVHSGHDVRLIAFDDKASELATLLKNKQSDSCVLLATNINPRMFAGTLYVSPTVGTRFFLDDDINAAQDCMESFGHSNPMAIHSSVHKIEHVSIADMNSFVLTADPQDIEYLCTCKVTDIQTRRGWYFLACSVCGRKIYRGSSSLSCNNCRDQTTVADVKYRVELVVDDSSSKTVFVVFDGEMEKLLSVEASRLASHLSDDGQHSDGAESIPDIISSLIGNTFTFHLRLTKFNFGPYRESIAVSRIIRDAPDVAKSSFLVEGSTVTNGSKPGGIAFTEYTGGFAALESSERSKKQRMV